MTRNPLKLSPLRGLLLATSALAALGALAVAPTIGPASANTVTHAAVTESCPGSPPMACLWIDGKGGSGAVLQITTPDGKPDMADNRMMGVTPQFTDDISVGHNGLPFDLCLYDTHTDRPGIRQPGSSSVSRTTKELVVPSGTDFAQLDDYNDVIDRYTTAPPGQCPHDVVFDNRDGHILSVSSR